MEENKKKTGMSKGKMIRILLVAAVVLVLVILQAWPYLSRGQCDSSTTGTITEIEDTVVFGNNAKNHILHISYEAEGQSYDTEKVVETDLYQVGDEIEVEYQSGDPAVCYVNDLLG